MRNYRPRRPWLAWLPPTAAQRCQRSGSSLAGQPSSRRTSLGGRTPACRAHPRAAGVAANVDPGTELFLAPKR